MTDKSASRPDLRHGVHGAVKDDTEQHVVGAESKKAPLDNTRILTPDPGNVVPGQGTKG